MRITRAWQYEDVLEYDCIYAVRSDDIELFKEIAPANTLYVKVSSHFPGKLDAACLYVSMKGVADAEECSDELVQVVNEWWRNTAGALACGNLRHARDCAGLPIVREAERNLALMSFLPLMQSIRVLLDQHMSLWDDKLPIAWRALGDRNSPWWDKPSFDIHYLELLMGTVDEVKKYGVNLEPFLSFIDTVYRMLKKWTALSLEDKCWFVSGYLLHHASRELTCERWTEVTVLCHRALDFLFLGCGLRGGGIVWDNNRGGFVYKRSGADTSVLGGIGELEAGSASYRFVKQLNYARNKSLFAHGIDKVASNEAHDAVKRSRDIYRRLCDNGALSQWVLGSAPRFNDARAWLFAAEDSYDSFFRIESI